MNTQWSDSIQTPAELYGSRALRFRDDNAQVWLTAMGVAQGSDVLDVGCGSGALLHQMKRLRPDIRATGLDRDDGSIAFAREKAAALGVDCRFVAGDGLNMPFGDASFDYVYSHTVFEHVPHEAFLGEHFRVLRPGGIAAVLSVFPSLGFSHEPAPSDEESVLMKKLWSQVDMRIDEEIGVAKYAVPESEVMRAMDTAGFASVSAEYISLLRYAPDNANVPKALALQMIEEVRGSALESIRKAAWRSPVALSDGEMVRLTDLVNARADTRLQQYLDGEKLYDMAVSAVAIVRGRKPQ